MKNAFVYVYENTMICSLTQCKPCLDIFIDQHRDLKGHSIDSFGTPHTEESAPSCIDKSRCMLNSTTKHTENVHSQ